MINENLKRQVSKIKEMKIVSENKSRNDTKLWEDKIRNVYNLRWFSNFKTRRDLTSDPTRGPAVAAYRVGVPGRQVEAAAGAGLRPRGPRLWPTAIQDDRSGFLRRRGLVEPFDSWLCRPLPFGARRVEVLLVQRVAEGSLQGLHPAIHQQWSPTALHPVLGLALGDFPRHQHRGILHVLKGRVPASLDVVLGAWRAQRQHDRLERPGRGVRIVGGPGFVSQGRAGGGGWPDDASFVLASSRGFEGVAEVAVEQRRLELGRHGHFLARVQGGGFWKPQGI